MLQPNKVYHIGIETGFPIARQLITSSRHGFIAHALRLGDRLLMTQPFRGLVGQPTSWDLRPRGAENECSETGHAHGTHVMRASLQDSFSDRRPGLQPCRAWIWPGSFTDFGKPTTLNRKLKHGQDCGTACKTLAEANFRGTTRHSRTCNPL